MKYTKTYKIATFLEKVKNNEIQVDRVISIKKKDSVTIFNEEIPQKFYFDAQFVSVILSHEHWFSADSILEITVEEIDKNVKLFSELKPGDCYVYAGESGNLPRIFLYEYAGICYYFSKTDNKVYTFTVTQSDKKPKVKVLENVFKKD